MTVFLVWVYYKIENWERMCVRMVRVSDTVHASTLLALLRYLGF